AHDRRRIIVWRATPLFIRLRKLLLCIRSEQPRSIGHSGGDVLWLEVASLQHPHPERGKVAGGDLVFCHGVPGDLVSRLAFYVESLPKRRARIAVARNVLSSAERIPPAGNRRALDPRHRANPIKNIP